MLDIGTPTLLKERSMLTLQRQPFYPSEETALEPVPGHYKYMLGLPTQL